MPQQQHTIPFRLIDGSEMLARRTGNNAAWNCPCDQAVPLLGYSDAGDSESEATVIRCPNETCGRRYRVVAPGLRQVPNAVVELG